MTRTILILMLLSAPAFAGIADWKSYEQGFSVTKKVQSDVTSGNGTAVAETGAGSSIVEALGSTGIDVPDESATGSARSISWITLEFAGSEETLNHRWKISGQMNGKGSGEAGGHLIHSCWADSVQALDVSGDLDLVGLACLGIEDSASGTFSLNLPPGLRVNLGNQTRTNKVDNYVLKEAKASTGMGKICRVRLDSYAKTSVEVKATLGSAYAGLYGRVYTDIEMTGTCQLPSGVFVKDTFRLGRCSTDPRQNEITPPNGGHEKRPNFPTDEPTEEEEDSDEPPPIDAKDLEKIHPEAATEDPYADDTADPTGGDADASGTTTTPDGDGTEGD